MEYKLDEGYECPDTGLAEAGNLSDGAPHIQSHAYGLDLELVKGVLIR
jgi:hypothetical protein